MALVLGAQTRAHALQPLDVFLTKAAETNPDVRVSQATDVQREAEADRATGSLLPTLQAQGVYTRNQFEVVFPGTLVGGTGNITFLPLNQYDGYFTVSIPLVDVGAWEKCASAKATHDAASADLAATRLDVSRRVARTYFQLLGNEAVLRSARHNLELSRQNAVLTVAKRSGGTASELDVQRAAGDVASAEEQVSRALQNVTTGRRALETLTGMSPEPATAFPADDLRREEPLEGWLKTTDRLPLVVSAVAASRAAEATASGAKAGWLPTLGATAQERLTNAPSLSLHSEYYTLQLTATWRLDATVPANIRAQRAAASAAIARADRTRRDVEDSIFNDWNQVRTSTDIARSARAQVEASMRAADLARDRYEGGVATQLDVLQAKQDLFRADVSRIQADADLAFARVSLRLDAARPIGDPL